MTARPDSHFLSMIQTLRRSEEVVLYNQLPPYTPEEAEAIKSFLEIEYQREALNYPHEAPPFQEDAALWGAQTIYIASQLLLHRQQKASEVPALLPSFDLPTDAGAIVSADLCLRFLPDLIQQLRLIDIDDVLVNPLVSLLHSWHYSGIRQKLAAESLDFSVVIHSHCLYQLYCDRIIAEHNLSLANHPVFRNAVSAQLGMYGRVLWSDFTIHTSSLHEPD